MNSTGNGWKRQCNHVDTLRVFGGIAIVLGFIAVLLVYANRNASSTGGHDLSILIYPAVYFVILGAGILFRFKIVAVVFSLSMAAIGLWLGFGSLVHARQTAWVLLNIPVALLCLIPAWSTIRGWQALK